MDKTLIGFKNLQQAKHISRMDDLAPATPYLRQKELEVQPHIKRVAQMWWAEVKENETIAPGTKLVPTGGIVWLLERKANGLEYYLWQGTDKVEDYVFNTYNREYVAGDRFMVVGDMDGDLWIIDNDQPLFAEAILAQDMCPPDDDDEYVVEVTSARYIPNCDEFTPTKVVNPYKHRGPIGAKVRMYYRHCPNQDPEWVIDEVEKTSACVVVGIENRESCMVYAALRTAQEWCGTYDEPDRACVIVEYNPCPDEPALPPCDETWVFDPLYACCWIQLVQGGSTGGQLLQGSKSNLGPGAVPGRFTSQ